MVVQKLVFGVDDKARGVGTNGRRFRGFTRRTGIGSSVTSFITGSSEESDDEEDIKLVKEEPEDQDEADPTPLKRKRGAAPPAVASKGTMVLAIDFGMTNSAIGFSVDTANPETVVSQRKFPGNRECHSKLPTLIAYKNDNLRYKQFMDDPSLQYVFGFQAEGATNRHAFFKRSLSTEARETVFDDPVLNEMRDSPLLSSSEGAEGLQAVEDSLRYLKDLIFTQVAEEEQPDTLAKFNLRTVVTHPAAFSDQAKKILFDKVVASGIKRHARDQIWLKSESECAAVAACVGNRSKFGSARWVDAFNVKTGVMVLDIGGLTCDATTFIVAQEQPRLVLEQSCPPQGGECGTVALLCRLFKLFETTFGEAFTTQPDSAVGHNSPLRKDIEGLFTEFEGEPAKLDRYHPLTLDMDIPGQDGIYDDVDGVMLLTGHQIKGVIDATAAFAKKIINEQISAHRAHGHFNGISDFVLCGGGSNFPYLNSTLSEFCRNHPVNKMQVLWPSDPMATVVRGALMSGLKERVLSKRRSRASYGIVMHEKFRPGDWNPTDVFDCPYGGKRINGFMRWHVKKGAEIDMTKPGIVANIAGYTILDMADLYVPTEHEVVIYTYKGDDREPPGRREHPGVSAHGSFVVRPSRMSAHMKTALKRKYGNSGSSKVKINIVQLIASNSGLIEFEARINKTVIGRYELTYDATMAA